MTAPPPAYVIHAHLDPATHEVAGRCRITYWNGGHEPLTSVWLQLYPNNFRPDSAYMRAAGARYNLDSFFPNGRDAGWLAIDRLRVNGRARSPGLSQGPYYEVKLAHPLRPGHAVHLDLGFTTHVPEVYDRFGRVGDAYGLAYWYPRVAVHGPAGWDLAPRVTPLQEFHDEHASFQVQLTLPRGYAVGATGHQLPNGLAPIPTERVVRFSAHDVRAFCLVTGPDFQVRTARRDGLYVHVLARPGEEAIAGRILDRTFEMVKFYRQLVGPYPYGDLTVASSEAIPTGGAELPQLALVSRALTRGAAIADGVAEVGYTAVLAHEVAHQWFFGVVGSDEVHDTWLDEALASYLAMRYLERPGGEDGGRPLRLEGGLAWLDRLAPFATQRENQLRAARAQDIAGLAVPLTTAIVDLPLGQIGPTYYARGPVVVEMLRQELGETAFTRFLQGLYARARFADADTALVQAEAERAAGRSLERFFATWVRGAGATLDHRLVGYRQERLANGKVRAIARIAQRGTTDLPVAVVFRTRDGREVSACYLPGQPEVAVETDAPVVAVNIDPGGCELERSGGRRGHARVGLLPVSAEELPLPGAGALRGDGPNHRGAAASPLGPGPLAPNLNLDLASIRSAHRGFSLGLQGGQPTWSVGLEQGIYGLGNYESSVAASIARRPEGYAGGAELGLAWQPRVGENPTVGVDLGAERRVYPGDATGAPAVGVNVARLDALLETRRVLYGVRPAGGRYRVGLEAAPAWLDTPGAFVTPSVELAQHLDLGWCTTLSGRAYAATTFGARDARDGLRLDREGLFRTVGLGAGDSLLAGNLEFTRPLAGAFTPPGFPLPLLLTGIAFASGGWVGEPAWEAGLGLRFGLFPIGQASLGLDWAPVSSGFGWQPEVFQVKGGFGF